MAAITPDIQDVNPEEAGTTSAKRKTPFMETVDNLRRSVSGKIGFIIIVFHISLALLSPYIVDAMPQDPFTREAGRNATPSLQHWFGGDEQGRDVFTRTLLGGRTLLLVTIFGTSMAMLWGSFVGIMLGFLGGRADEVMMRLVDAFLAIPWLLFLLCLLYTSPSPRDGLLSRMPSSA